MVIFDDLGFCKRLSEQLGPADWVSDRQVLQEESATGLLLHVQGLLYTLTNSVELGSVKEAPLFIPFLKPPCFYLSRCLQILGNVAVWIGFDHLQIDQLAHSLISLWERTSPYVVRLGRLAASTPLCRFTYITSALSISSSAPLPENLVLA